MEIMVFMVVIVVMAFMAVMETMGNLVNAKFPGFIKIIKTIEKKRAKFGKKCERPKELIKKGKKLKNSFTRCEFSPIHCVRREWSKREHKGSGTEWSAFAVREVE
jgi:hypothetical protein